MSKHRGAPPKVPRLTITLDSDDLRIIFDKPAQRLRIMRLDGGGLPIGRIEEHTFADALTILHEVANV